MRAFILTIAAALLLAPAAFAECKGQNQIAEMSPDAQAALRAQAAQYPYGSGNYWQATRGAEVIHLIGTYHMDDPRHAATLAAVAPTLNAATILLVEAGPEEEAALKSRMATHPELLVNTEGPTLPEVLSPAEWEQLSKAMTARGIPAFMAAKFRPWYISVMLGIPPCAIEDATKSRGLDGMLQDTAAERGIPVQALEPYDTIFGIFDQMTPQDQIDMITTALTTEDQSDDMAATLADTYFDQETRLLWEFSRLQALEQPGYTPERVDSDFAEMETAMMSDRNQSWIPVIEAAAAKGPVFAGFGALHLSGEKGVLNLLAQDGYTITELPLP
jgi:uncharacterized protein